MSKRIKDSKGHEWQKDSDGNIDLVTFDVNFHNGPTCVKCGYSFCVHCKDNPDEPCSGNKTADKMEQGVLLFLVKVANLPESKREAFLNLVDALWNTDSDTELESVIDTVLDHVENSNISHVSIS